MNRLARLTTAALSLAAAGVALLLAPAEARAVELYWDGTARVVVLPPPPLVIPAPRIVTPRYVVRVNPPPPNVVVIGTRPAPQTVVVDDGPDDGGWDDAYDAGDLVVVGGGMGGLMFLGDGITSVVPTYKLHVGLAVDAAEFAVRFDMAPDAGEVVGPDGLPTPAALYTAGASFNYRFLPRAVVHPVMGVGLESVILDPHAGKTGNAFAVTGRVGLELAYPLADGALALGIDATGHHPFVATDQYAGAVVDMVSFGAYGDWRF